MCQKSEYFSINCGQTINPIWLTEVSKNEKEYWEVQYTFGDDWRIAIFKFVVDDKVEKPKVKFVSEHPRMQYVSLCLRTLPRLYN